MLFSCSVWSPKGGCGKSTIALTLASFFAAEDTSRKVLLVDIDAQQSARTWEARAEFERVVDGLIDLAAA
ncbi:ParA family protein [Burkholderia cenocepacia]|uniref:ParA family protein n=1 Tax=Burkholderia cenocepacia TaxID=95486 RepID=UPI001B9D0966|nr:ParA family protein [Burkholderia cenocepacia]MBR7945408.1 ParA family protein [Burkholderia cenocepacia]